jgi:hypothetical protein
LARCGAHRVAGCSCDRTGRSVWQALTHCLASEVSNLELSARRLPVPIWRGLPWRVPLNVRAVSCWQSPAHRVPPVCALVVCPLQKRQFHFVGQERSPEDQDGCMLSSTLAPCCTQHGQHIAQLTGQLMCASIGLPSVMVGSSHECCRVCAATFNCRAFSYWRGRARQQACHTIAC